MTSEFKCVVERAGVITAKRKKAGEEKERKGSKRSEGKKNETARYESLSILQSTPAVNYAPAIFPVIRGFDWETFVPRLPPDGEEESRLHSMDRFQNQVKICHLCNLPPREMPPLLPCGLVMPDELWEACLPDPPAPPCRATFDLMKKKTDGSELTAPRPLSGLGPRTLEGRMQGSAGGGWKRSVTTTKSKRLFLHTSCDSPQADLFVPFPSGKSSVSLEELRVDEVCVLRPTKHHDPVTHNNSGREEERYWSETAEQNRELQVRAELNHAGSSYTFHSQVQHGNSHTTAAVDAPMRRTEET
ncbi:hypothetical protein EYF80_029185 [Liparis tanakae]|uniref:Uncharacterized protein n=1 Tax=Liparis tanakae TaxID=230148 RepID=A0A4Z2H6Y7_9TELE|nr:hypothetical protein EYF80_029185 [Liparis tanakae]